MGKYIEEAKRTLICTQYTLHTSKRKENQFWTMDILVVRKLTTKSITSILFQHMTGRNMIRKFTLILNKVQSFS